MAHITLTFDADCIENLLVDLRKLLNALEPTVVKAEYAVNYDSPPISGGPKEPEEAKPEEQAPTEPQAAPRKRNGRARKETPPEEETPPAASPDPLNDIDPKDLDDPEDDPTMPAPTKTDVVALHRLKEETLKKLRDLYVSGKGAYVRSLLAKHGHGALVFPEVDPKHFPAIRADLDKGAA